MLINVCSLLSDAGFIPLCVNHFQQIQGVVDARRGITLNLFHFVFTFPFVVTVSQSTTSSDRPGSCRFLRSSLLSTGLGRRLGLGWRSSLFFSEQARILCFPCKFRFAFLLLFLLTSLPTLGVRVFPCFRFFLFLETTDIQYVIGILPARWYRSCVPFRRPPGPSFLPRFLPFWLFHLPSLRYRPWEPFGYRKTKTDLSLVRMSTAVLSRAGVSRYGSDRRPLLLYCNGHEAASSCFSPPLGVILIPPQLCTFHLFLSFTSPAHLNCAPQLFYHLDGRFGGEMGGWDGLYVSDFTLSRSLLNIRS